MSIVDSPPSSNHFVVWRITMERVSACEPRLVGTDEMDHVDARLKVSICGKILVVGGWSNVVGEAQAVVVIAEVHVDQALIGAVK